MKPTTLRLIRHGETTLNVDKRYRGRADPPLTRTGVEQALCASRRPDLSDSVAIYTSPRLRARQTADIIGEPIGLTPVVDSPLDDIDYGEWTSLTKDEANARWPKIYEMWTTRPESAELPGGERVSDVVARVRAALHDYATRHAGSSVIVVTHDVIVRLVLCDALGAPLSAMHRIRVDLTSITTLCWDDGLVLVGANDTGHLAALDTESQR